MPATRRAARCLAVLSLATLAPAAAASAEFSTTNVQFLYGWGFHDNKLGYDAENGRMSTVTFDHFSTWKYGDDFFFADMYRLNALGGYHADTYVEWHPRLFLNQLGLPTAGIVKNWGVAGEINIARGFYGYLAGLGLDLAIPGFTVAGLNLYYRWDNFAHSTWQVSPFWTVPFEMGPVRFLFTGFVDVTTDQNQKLDVMAQPELLFDVLALAGSPDRLYVGIEWYLHEYRNFVDDKDKLVSAPQAMVQWTIY